MKILGLYLNNFVRTGGQRRYLELMEALAERGNEVFVVMDKNFIFNTKYFNRIDIAVKYGRGKLRLPYMLRYRSAVKKAKSEILSTIGFIDWVHIHGELHFLAAEILRRSLGAPLFFAFRANSFQRQRICLKASSVSFTRRIKAWIEEKKTIYWERRVAKTAAIICFQSQTDTDDYLRRAPNGMGKTVVIPGAVDGPRFKPELRNTNRSDKLQKLLYVGLVDDSKGIIYLLKALGELKKRGIDGLELIVLGRGDRIDVCRELCVQLNIDNNVEFWDRFLIRFHGLSIQILWFIQVYMMLFQMFCWNVSMSEFR